MLTKSAQAEQSRPRVSRACLRCVWPSLYGYADLERAGWRNLGLKRALVSQLQQHLAGPHRFKTQYDFAGRTDSRTVWREFRLTRLPQDCRTIADLPPLAAGRGVALKFDYKDIAGIHFIRTTTRTTFSF